MHLTLVGLGCGTAETVTHEGAAALKEADAVIGAPRLLEALTVSAPRFAETRPQAIARLLEEGGWSRPCVVYSGDTGFYSGTRALVPLLDGRGMAYRVLPGISSVQVLSARLGRPWQDWVLCSAHGAECDPVGAVSQGKPAFFLTGGGNTPAALCRALAEAGLGTLPVTVGEDLTYPGERITETTAAEAMAMTFSPLSVLLAESAPRFCRAPGIPDGAFLRGAVPMTKQEVRAAILAKLAVLPGDVLWDVGAGTGSVSVELALAAPRGRVYAVERSGEGCALIRENRTRFSAWNLTLVPGEAPEALEALPAPDAVFIGGSGGKLTAILDAVLAKNPRARVCISAIALETLFAAVTALSERGLAVETAQIAVSKTQEAGRLHLLMAANPVFLITAGREEPE